MLPKIGLFKDLNFDMISLNAQGLRDYTKRRKVFNFMQKHTSSKGIIFMQETHSPKTCENRWANQFGCGNISILYFLMVHQTSPYCVSRDLNL